MIEGQDKVYKDVIEPLESVSVNLIPTSKQTIKEFGPPKQVMFFSFFLLLLLFILSLLMIEFGLVTDS